MNMSCSVSLLLLLLLLSLSCFSTSLCFAMDRDTITFSTPIKDSDTLVSNGGSFVFGFFSPGASTSRYVGIWFNNIPVQTVVWVANKDNPIDDSSGVISVSEDGNLVLMDGLNRIHWSTNISVLVSGNATWAKLQDSGNLVLQEDKNNGETLWESFKHPCDIFLSKMKLGTDATTGTTSKLVSWKTPSDPSPGNFTAGFAALTFPELFIWKENDTPVWRSGPWNGQTYIGLPEIDWVGLFLYAITINNDNEGTVSLSYDNDTLMNHFVLDYRGMILQRLWSNARRDWTVGYSIPSTECDVYGKCGEFGSCNIRRDPPCECIRGFEPKNRTEWNRRNWINGCVRKTLLQCETGDNNGTGNKVDGFLKLRKMKVPMSPHRPGGNERDCRKICLQNCSCTAYAIDTGLGCLLWTGSLLDMQEFSVTGIDLYVRLAKSEFNAPNNRPIIIMIPVVGGAFILAVCGLLAWRANMKRRERERNERLILERMEAITSGNVTSVSHTNQAKLKELPLFEFQVLAAATDGFDVGNKLGQGGFGPVYKGKLQSGQDIAVKRLSRASGQGLEELVNEVAVISKLQHRNLVRLLGCCIEGEERMLVYEFMPKKSLDSYLFDPANRKLLDWKTRFSIIEGICRGLLYLHRDSRLRIIHRDLKTSNILLDEHLNPKISDFGLARVFRGNEDEANTGRVVGTYGYMSPEYAMGGLFSEKSDVFSLGVILLEIISGRRNTSFHNNEQAMNLLAYAWRLWNDDKAIDLADPESYEERFEREVQKCVHIGLLCVQDLANERPSVSTVIWMLSTDNAELPEPKQPAFIATRSVPEAESSEEPSDQNGSINGVTVTSLTGR